MSWLDLLGMLGGETEGETGSSQVASRAGATGLSREGKRLETLRIKKRKEDDELIDIITALALAGEI